MFGDVPVGVETNSVGELNLDIVELDRGSIVVVALRREEVMEFQYRVP
jgi:hypothetical protein